MAWLARMLHTRDHGGMTGTITHRPSVCPHDCPSACALDVEVIDGARIGRIRGAQDQTYTAGVICAKASMSSTERPVMAAAHAGVRLARCACNSSGASV